MPAFLSTVNSGVSSSVDGTRGSVQGKANPHKTASQAIAAHVVQRHPLSLDRPRDPCRVCRFLRVLFLPVASSSRSTWPSDALARPSLVHFADGETTTCFLSVHHCSHWSLVPRQPKIGSAVRLCVDSFVTLSTHQGLKVPQPNIGASSIVCFFLSSLTMSVLG